MAMYINGLTIAKTENAEARCCGSEIFAPSSPRAMTPPAEAAMLSITRPREATANTGANATSAHPTRNSTLAIRRTFRSP